jgi:RNA polymerase sigma factor (sigma-70 family)
MLGVLVRDLQRSEERRLHRFFLYRLRNWADAADATQETFLRLLSSTPRGGIDNPKAYLFQTARHIAFDHALRRRRRASVECPIADPQAVLSVPCDAPSPETTLIDRQRLRLFEEALLRLPERARTALLLSRMEGWTYPLIAEHLGVSANTVYNDVRSAMAHCMTVMARQERD